MANTELVCAVFLVATKARNRSNNDDGDGDDDDYDNLFRRQEVGSRIELLAQ